MARGLCWSGTSEFPRAVAKNSLGKLSREAAVPCCGPELLDEGWCLGHHGLKQGRWAVGFKVHPGQMKTWYHV